MTTKAGTDASDDATSDDATPEEPTPDNDAVAAEGLTYGEALAELEELLDDLEGADVDVDHLAERVARGVQLVRFCRARLEVVTDEVDSVVAELITIEGRDESQDDTNGDENGHADDVAEGTAPDDGEQVP